MGQPKQLLPDGRWQHYCIKCGKPHTYPHMFTDSFDFKVRCGECREPDPGFRVLKVSACE